MTAPEDVNATQRIIDGFLARQTLPVGEHRPCTYLPGREALHEGFAAENLSGEAYRAFLDRGFRRSGHSIYRPVCNTCRKCRQLRVSVAGFVLSRSQRRVWRRNGDVVVSITDKPQPTEEKWRLFFAYLNSQHDGRMITRYDDFVAFLYASPIETLEFSYKLGGRLAGVGIVDRCDGALSSVYMYFDPAFGFRSLGTFSVLTEIDYCRRSGLAYYYMGYWVADSKSMDYKARFQPHEVLDESFVWEKVSARTDG